MEATIASGALPEEPLSQMNFFEFVLVITSVVYALCIAPLLSGFVRILQFDGHVKHFFPQAVIAVFLFILVPMQWWSMWLFRDVELQFATYFYIFIEPIFLYIACALIFPQRIDAPDCDLEGHYYRVRFPLFASLVTLLALLFADDVIIGNEAVWHPRRFFQLFVISAMAWALVDTRRVAQYAAAFGGLIVQLTLILFWFWNPPG